MMKLPISLDNLQQVVSSWRYLAAKLDEQLNQCDTDLKDLELVTERFPINNQHRDAPGPHMDITIRQQEVLRSVRELEAKQCLLKVMVLSAWDMFETFQYQTIHSHDQIICPKSFELINHYLQVKQDIIRLPNLHQRRRTTLVTIQYSISHYPIFEKQLQELASRFDLHNDLATIQGCVYHHQYSFIGSDCEARAIHFTTSVQDYLDNRCDIEVSPVFYSDPTGYAPFQSFHLADIAQELPEEPLLLELFQNAIS